MVTDKVLIYLGEQLKAQYNINCVIGGSNPTGTGIFLTQYNSQGIDYDGQDVNMQVLILESDTTEHKAFIKAQAKAKDIINKIKNIIDVYEVKEVPVMYEKNTYYYSVNFTTTEEV